MLDSFARANDYDAHAIVQARVVADLADRVAKLPLPPQPRVLEVGCGTGLLAATLAERLTGSQWMITDVSPAMVERSRRRFGARPDMEFAVLDAERPHLDGPFDLICSSLAAQWFSDLPAAVARLRALLAPTGWLVFTTLAAGSFEAWRRAHGALPCGIRDYPPPDHLAALGLDVYIDAHVDPNEGARAFLRSMKAIGAGTPRPGHRPLPPAQLRAIMRRFDEAGEPAAYMVATCLTGASR